MNWTSSFSRRGYAALSIVLMIVASCAMFSHSADAEGPTPPSAPVPPAASADTQTNLKGEWCVQTPTNECRPKACASGKPVIVLFTAKWCGFCKHLETKVIPDPEVQKLLKKFFLIVIDAEVNPDITKESGVAGYPTFFIIEKGCGKMIDAFAGTPMTPKAFLKKFTPYTAH